MSASVRPASPSPERQDASLRRRRRLVVLLALTPALLVLLWLVILARLRAVNPALRSPRTWTTADRTRLFHDASLHWCDPHPLEPAAGATLPGAGRSPLHLLGRPADHASGRGLPWRCKGRINLSFAAFLLAPRPDDHRILKRILEHIEPGVAVRSATLLAIKGELAEADLRSLAERLQRDGRTRELEMLCWAIGRTRARSCLPIVLDRFQQASKFRRFAADRLLSPAERKELWRAWSGSREEGRDEALRKLELARNEFGSLPPAPFFPPLSD